MRALPFLTSASALLLAGAACIAGVACSSNDAVSPVTTDGGDAGTAAPPAIETTDPGPPDAAGNPASKGPKDAAPDAPVFSGPTSTLAAATDALAAGECAFLERCFPEYTDNYTGSLAGCTSGAATQLRGMFAPTALFSQAEVAATASCYASLGCGALYGSFGQTHCPLPRPVNGAPLGAACNENNDCASSFCNGPTSSSCGTCAASTVVSLGATCGDGNGEICPAGSICNGRCVVELGPGDACTTGGATPPTSICADSLDCIGGTCTKAGGPGASCAGTAACDTFQLQVCDDTTNQCVTVQWLGGGDACIVGKDARMCGGGLRCIAPAGTTAGTCAPAIEPGHACVRTSSCTFGYDCKSNVCVPQGSTRPTCN